MKELLYNLLPYLEIEPTYNEKELKLDEVKEITVPDLTGEPIGKAKNIVREAELSSTVRGEGDTITNQFPLPGEAVNKNAQIILYTE